MVYSFVLSAILVIILEYILLTTNSCLPKEFLKNVKNISYFELGSDLKIFYKMVEF